MTGQGYSVAEAARNLGLHANLLRTWKRTFTTEAAEERDLTEEERMKPARLRAENKRLRRERDVRKTATARRRRFEVRVGPTRARSPNSPLN